MSKNKLGGRFALIAGVPEWTRKELDEFTGRVMSGHKKVEIRFVEVENRTKGEIMNKSTYPLLQEM